MLRVHVVFHKDGDRLTVVQVPWWLPIYEWLAMRFCPCCGLTGLLSKISEKVEYPIYKAWNFLLGKTLKFEKILYEVPVNGCIASQKIFNREDACWRDDCENCWHLREDAYDSSGRV